MIHPLRLPAAIFGAAILLTAAGDDAVRKEIQAAYDHALAAQRQAKTIEDLDAVSRQIDTPDWVSIVADAPPQHWSDLREQAARSLGHFPESAIRIVKCTVAENTAVVIARVGSPQDVNSSDLKRGVLIRDTWVKTPAGWRRKMHEKPAPGKLDSEIARR